MEGRYYACTKHKDADGYPVLFQHRHEVCCPGDEVDIPQTAHCKAPVFECPHCGEEAHSFWSEIEDSIQEGELVTCDFCEKRSQVVYVETIIEVRMEAIYDEDEIDEASGQTEESADSTD